MQKFATTSPSKVSHACPQEQFPYVVAWSERRARTAAGQRASTRLLTLDQRTVRLYQQGPRPRRPSADQVVTFEEASTERRERELPIVRLALELATSEEQKPLLLLPPAESAPAWIVSPIAADGSLVDAASLLPQVAPAATPMSASLVLPAGHPRLSSGAVAPREVVPALWMRGIAEHEVEEKIRGKLVGRLQPGRGGERSCHGRQERSVNVERTSAEALIRLQFANLTRAKLHGARLEPRQGEG